MTSYPKDINISRVSCVNTHVVGKDYAKLTAIVQGPLIIHSIMEDLTPRDAIIV